MTAYLTRAAALALTLLVIISCSESPTEPVTAPTDFPNQAAAATLPGSWTTRAAYPRAWVFNAMSATVTKSGRSTMYVIGGHPGGGPGRYQNVVFAYNVTANTWRRVANFPLHAYGSNNAVEINGKIYVAGAVSRRWDAQTEHWLLDWTGTLFVYDPAANTWRRKRDMPVVGPPGLVAASNGLLYVAAPCGNICNPNLQPGDLFRYNPSTDQWVLLGKTPHDPAGAGGGFVGGKLYVVAPTFFDEHAPVDIYDPATGKWSSGPSMPGDPVCSAFPSTTMQAKVYLIDCQGSTQVLDPKAGAWTQAAPPPSPDISRHGTMSRVFVNGQPRLELVVGASPGNNVQFRP